MEFSPFKLLIFMIAAAAVIYIIILLFSPYLIPRDDVFKNIEDRLATAEGFKGEFNSKTISYPPQFSFKAAIFDTVNRSVNFSCNAGGLCCGKGEKCGRTEWDERYIYFPKSEKITTSARCDFAHGLFACTIYFGSEPAQLKLKDVPGEINFDAGQANELALSFGIHNSGSKAVLGSATSTIKIYKEVVIEGVKEKSFRFQDSQTLEKLAVDKTKTLHFTVPLEKINENGNYVLEIKTESPEAGFDEKIVNLTVSNVFQPECVTDRTGTPYLDGDLCKKNLYCKDCSLAVECSSAWEEKLGLRLEIIDPEYTTQIIPLSECD